MNADKKGVCHNCDKREIGCHSTCEDYLDWRAKWEAEKEYIYNQKQKENQKRMYLKDIHEKERRKRGYNKYK